jgi:lycopene cyclase domain-containing protein
MSYTGLAVLGAVLAGGVDLLALRTKLLLHKAFWAAYAIMVFFQLVTNGVLTGLPVVRYDPDGIIGWRLVHAPVEDLLFGFALIVVTLSIWVRLGARAATRAGR